MRLLVRAWIKADVRQMRKSGIDPVAAYADAYRRKDMGQMRDIASLVHCSGPRVFAAEGPPPC